MWGLDHALHQRVREWATQPEIQQFLEGQRKAVERGAGWATLFDNIGRALTPYANKRTVYVRVIYRVFVVGKVNVVLLDARQGAFALDVGVPKQMTLLKPSLPSAPGKTPTGEGPAAEGKAAEGQPAESGDNGQSNGEVTAFEQTLKTVSNNIGGSVQLEWASKRSVAMQETFERPLVIGYLSFDFPVLPGGELGYPVATRHQLEGSGPSADQGSRNDGLYAAPKEEAEYVLMANMVASLDGEISKSIYENAAKMLREKNPVFRSKYDQAIGEHDPPNKAFSRAKTAATLPGGGLSLTVITGALRSAWDKASNPLPH